MTTMQQLVSTSLGLRRNRRAVRFVERNMRFAGLRRLWLVVATASLLSSPDFASGAMSFICDGDSVARPACCCPGGEHVRSAPSVDRASLSPACCCHVSRTDARRNSVITSPRAVTQADAKAFSTPVSTLTLDTLAPTRKGWPAFRLAQPPPRAVPILLAKQSLLV